MEYDVGTQESLRNIFSAVMIGGIDLSNREVFESKRSKYQYSVSRFLSSFPHNVFQDEYAFLYIVLKTIKIHRFTVNQLETLVYQNQDLILTSPLIDISRWAITADGNPAVDDEKIDAFRASLVETFIELSNNDVSNEEFESSIRAFVNYYQNQRSLEVAQQMTMILSPEGMLWKRSRGRTVKLQGIDDSRKFYSQEMEVIQSLNAEESNLSTMIDSDWLRTSLERTDSKEDDMLPIGIQVIDSAMGALRRTRILGVLGPPKGGKTRFSNFLVAKFLEAGYNVAVWPLEGTEDEWLAMQLSNMVRVNCGVYIPSKNILTDRYEDAEQKKLVDSQRTMLAVGKDRGRLSFIGGLAYVEDFIDVLKNHYESMNPYDVVVIDSLVNILSRNNVNKVQRISDAYMSLKHYISKTMPRKALAIIPTQLKQETVDFLRKNPDETIDVTAGGESAETIRTPDDVLGLFSSKEERNSGLMKIYSVASRHNEAFNDVTVRCELGCCYFYDDPDLN